MPAPTDDLKKNVAWVFREIIERAGWESVLAPYLPEGAKAKTHIVREQVNALVITMPDDKERYFEFKMIEHG